MIGPATSFAMGEGNTMISALWGVFVWKEFKGATSRVKLLLAMMFLFFLLGLTINRTGSHRLMRSILRWLFAAGAISRASRQSPRLPPFAVPTPCAAYCAPAPHAHPDPAE